MNRSSLLRLLALATMMVAGCVTSPSSTPAPASSSTAGLGVYQPPRILRAVDIGHTDATQTIELLLAMRRPAGSDVDALLREQGRVDSHEKFLAPRDFGDRFGASAADYVWLIAWAQSNGFDITYESPSRTTLNVHGTIANVEAALHTRIDDFKDTRGVFRAPALDPALDPAVDKIVVGVMGLDNADPPRPMVKPPHGNANNGSQTPPDLQARYGVDVAGTTYGVHGEGETIAILGTGGPPIPTTDIDPFVKKYGPLVSFDRHSQYTQIFLGGPNRDPATLAQTEYGENVLDISMVMSIAPAASVVHVLTAVNAGGLFEQGIPYIVNQVPQAHAATVSYGGCERGSESEFITLDQLFSQAKAQGQQWFFATGDNGSDGCADGDPMAVLSAGYPSTSIYVMGVGGTQLSAGVEQAWVDGGGGQSEAIPKPAYQIGIGPYPNDGVRDTPDVACMAGDPGVSIYIEGSLQPGWEGTSVATPLFASVWALLDQSQGGLGLRNSHEEMYALGAAKLGFHDIVKGNNGSGTTAAGYSALPGYDLATGWGSPDLPSLIANWKN